MRYLSLFSGMEAATIAWRPLGWECVGVSEIDPAACAVLRHRLPGVPNLGGVTEITDADIAALGPIDVVIGGSPCQDLSVAGKRAGLAGERSNLFHEQMRIFNAARTLCGARWLIWENVPGAFSSNKGRDFAVVAGAMAGCQLPVPADGWGSEGVALGDNGLVEWAVLDSQWFGVAQRRRRVFAVLDTGDWASRPPVLLEPESLRGDSAPRRETGEVVAPTLDVRAGRSGETSFHTSGGLVPQWPAGVAGTLSARPSGGGGLGTDFECQGGLVPEVSPAVTSKWAKGTGGPAGDECQNLVPVAFDTTQITSKANGSNPQPGDPCHPLTAGGHAPAVTFPWQQGGSMQMSHDVDLCGTLVKNQTQAVAFQSSQSGVRIGDVHATLDANNGPRRHNGALVGMAVRRLTPRECERLQAAPDDWTLVPNDRGKPMADGPRYRMCGNSFTATVIRWIGRRLEVAHDYGKQIKGVE